MTTRARGRSPQAYARAGGALYLFIIAAALFGEAVVRGRLITWGDPAATARAILGSETLFRAGLAGELLTCVCDVALALILFVLLEPVSRNLALLAAFFRLTFVAVYAVTKLFMLAAVLVLKGADQLSAFEPEQLDALAYLSLRVHGQGYGVSLIFFGVTCLVLGALIRRSGYLPAGLGVLLAAGGLGYLIGSFALVLAPALSSRLFPGIVLPAFVAELGLAAWLLVKGVDVPRWEARARASGAPEGAAPR